MQNSQGFPQITAPVVNPSGEVNQIWLQFFITLWNRTGGASGGVNQITPIKIEGISPFSYSVPTPGNIWINPGCYTSVSIIRGGTQLNFGYVTRGIFPVDKGDTIEFKYTTLPPTVYLI